MTYYLTRDKTAAIGAEDANEVLFYFMSGAVEEVYREYAQDRDLPSWESLSPAHAGELEDDMVEFISGRADWNVFFDVDGRTDRSERGDLGRVSVRNGTLH